MVGVAHLQLVEAFINVGLVISSLSMKTKLKILLKMMTIMTIISTLINWSLKMKMKNYEAKEDKMRKPRLNYLRVIRLKTYF